MRIYMDVCCLNRPFDDQTQDKIRIETDLGTIRRMGIEALIEKLGPIGVVEFIRQFDSGYGDYTRERQEWLDGLDIETIVKQAEAKRN